jgi:protein involved in temperature-dependent protein secretion
MFEFQAGKLIWIKFSEICISLSTQMPEYLKQLMTTPFQILTYSALIIVF